MTKTPEKIDMLKKFQACIVLHSLGDTIGFKNGEWEFNYGNKNVSLSFSNELLYEFIELGGINKIILKSWLVSDDTIMHLATARALIKNYETLEDLYKGFVAEYIKSFDDMISRAPGVGTEKSVELLKRGIKWNEVPYDHSRIGNGSAMRSSVIGLAFHKKEDFQKLMEVSIEAGRITHNSAIGMLASFTAALFTAYAIRNISPTKWAIKLVKILKSDKIEKYLEKTRGLTDYNKDKNEFIDRWKLYINKRFVGSQFVDIKSMRNPEFRTRFFYDNFAHKTNVQKMPGATGDDALIIAYDALLDCHIDNGEISFPSWEKLVVYSMLHAGDSDTTGAIAGSWYGALYGYIDVPESNLTYLEYKSKSIKLGEEIYIKYVDSQSQEDPLKSEVLHKVLRYYPNKE